MSKDKFPEQIWLRNVDENVLSQCPYHKRIGHDDIKYIRSDLIEPILDTIKIREEIYNEIIGI